MIVDSILNNFSRPVFVNEPAEVFRRLKATYPEDWTKVLIGETGTVVTVPEYLYREKYDDVLKILREVVQKKDLPLYLRNPERFEILLERTTQKIIQRVQDS